MKHLISVTINGPSRFETGQWETFKLKPALHYCLHFLTPFFFVCKREYEGKQRSVCEDYTNSCPYFEHCDLPPSLLIELLLLAGLRRQLCLS
jgi:hypothetical protein